MITNDFLEYSRRLRDKSLSMGIPSIEEDEGLILYTTVYLHTINNRDHYVAVDAGAGIGYSTIWIAKALKDAGCNICVVEAIEKDKFYASRIIDNVKGAGIHDILVKVSADDAVNVMMNKPAESIDLLFVDIEKNRYPRLLEESYYKLKDGGIVVFHNALFPPPPQRLYDVLSRFRMKYTVIPTINGLLLAVK